PLTSKKSNHKDETSTLCGLNDENSAAKSPLTSKKSNYKDGTSTLFGFNNENSTTRMELRLCVV
ncbi:9837_t:CDS:1, partial [Dentiscutata heterogama]